MAIEIELKKRLQQRIEDLQVYSIKHFDDAKNDARWYTTLVFAELAGIASYVGSPVSSGLKHYSMVVLILGIALVSFIYASIQTQRGKAEYGKLYAIARNNIREIEADTTISVDEADSKALVMVDEFSNVLVLNKYENAEFWGLTLFAIGTILIAIFIFLSSFISIVRVIIEPIAKLCT